MTEQRDDPIQKHLASRGYARHVVEGGIEGLVASWERVATETERGYAGTFHEWLNDMDGREILHETLGFADAATRARLGARVEAADRRFARVVEPLARCVWSDRAAREHGWTPTANPWYFVRPKIAHDELRLDFEHISARPKETT